MLEVALIATVIFIMAVLMLAIVWSWLDRPAPKKFPPPPPRTGEPVCGNRPTPPSTLKAAATPAYQPRGKVNAAPAGIQPPFGDETPDTIGDMLAASLEAIAETQTNPWSRAAETIDVSERPMTMDEDGDTTPRQPDFDQYGGYDAGSQAEADQPSAYGGYESASHSDSSWDSGSSFDSGSNSGGCDSGCDSGD